MVYYVKTGDDEVKLDGPQAALDHIYGRWPQAVIYESGFLVEGSQDLGAATSCEGRALVWASEADSVNDDGSKAVAEIRRD